MGLDTAASSSPSIPADTRADLARDYLRTWLADEDYFTDLDPKSVVWFHDLAEHVGSLPSTDPRVAAAGRYLQPFLDDDDRVEEGLYSRGNAVAFVEATPWGGPFDPYFTGFIDALATDHGLWEQAVTTLGTAARWTAAVRPPGQPNLVHILRRHVGDTIGINYNDPTALRKAVLVGVSEDTLTIAPAGVGGVLHFPLRWILQVQEANPGRQLAVGGLFSRSPVPVVVTVYHLVVYKGFIGFEFQI